jgi:erythromycin esterase-like protein
MRRRFLSIESPDETRALQDRVAAKARPLHEPSDLDALVNRIGEARYVLLGEASHGTHEYYTWRMVLSQRLIKEKGFSFVAVEGDWPDCNRVNRFARGLMDSSECAREVLYAFDRWPTWMWANEEVVELVSWLRQHNERLAQDERVGFYGLDVYSLWDSLYRVMAYLHRSRPELLPAARRAFECFEPYGEDVQYYAQATQWVDRSCEDEVVRLLAELHKSGKRFSQDDREEQFDAEQNALVVKNAEHYYRTMVRGGPESWNIRDRHMTETLERLVHHCGPQAKAIVWEHNTHIGDARHTDMADDGMVNVGQLVRESHAAEDVVLVGFGSNFGSVIAAGAWEAPFERMSVPPGQPGTWEDVLHDPGSPDKFLIFDEDDRSGPMAKMRGHRAIGVVYHPEYESGNYVPSVLPRRYDALLFLDETQALHPLHEVQPREEGEVPETFPTGV